MSFQKIFLLICILLATHFASAQTITQVFDYAQATYPSLFSGTPVSGTYLQYTYRYYPTSKHYLAVDTGNVISLLGPSTNNSIRAIGPISAFAGVVNAWVASQATSGGLATAVVGLCPTKDSGSSYSACSGTGSNAMTKILDPVYNSIKSLTGKITISTQPSITIGTDCTLAIETYFGIFVAKIAGITNTQSSFQSRAVDTIYLSSTGAIGGIMAGDQSKGPAIEINILDNALEYVSYANSTQYAVCKIFY